MAESSAVRFEETVKAPLGYPDTSVSIDIPIKGKLKPLPLLSSPQSVLTLFHGREAVSVNEQPPARYQTFFVWILERGEWVGLQRFYYSEYAQNVWGGGIEEYIDFKGPFCLNAPSAEFILEAYGARFSYSGEQVLLTPPETLIELQLNRRRP